MFEQKTTQRLSQHLYRPIIELTRGKHGQIVLIAVLQKADLGSEEKNREKLDFRECFDFQRSAWMRRDERLDLLIGHYSLISEINYNSLP